MYDAICKSLVESFPADFATWLLGKPITLTELEPKKMRQIVIYLTPTTPDLVYQTAFDIPRTRHEFEVIRDYRSNP